jgi:carbamoyl-phosphate synthase large subunit
VLIVGSGPIVIGQAAEFDYSGTQACLACREAGVRTVLVNSNPATIQTDSHIADTVYIEPLTPESLTAIIERERPDGIIATVGGQTALNLAVALDDLGVFERYGVRVLGTGLDAIRRGEDRALFAATLRQAGEPILPSRAVTSVEEARAAAEEIGYPVMCRSAFALGGAGSGFAGDDDELVRQVEAGLRASGSHQVLIEKSVYGWSEIEYEVVRDAAGNCLTVCNMENVDPMGVHTGDSIVVAPSQTLSDDDYHLLRRAAIRVVDALGVEGACNVQFALDRRMPGRYFVIEVNPRLSRSSALASKATGYPIAKVATRIALGQTIPEIRNDITGTSAFFEPALDYVVVKIPRWPYDKFQDLDPIIGTGMRSTGEVMAIGRTFEEAMGKAMRSVDAGKDSRASADLEQDLIRPNSRRLAAVLSALRAGWPAEQVADLSHIHPWFVDRLASMAVSNEPLAVSNEPAAVSYQPSATNNVARASVPDPLNATGIGDGGPSYTVPSTIPSPDERGDIAQPSVAASSRCSPSMLEGEQAQGRHGDARRHGTLFGKGGDGAPSPSRPGYPLGGAALQDGVVAHSSSLIAHPSAQLGATQLVYKMVDTCAAEFEARTPYFYGSELPVHACNEALPLPGPKAIILGSGPIRIGQGIEFDYATVHACHALTESGVKSIIVNNNPETVSTDYSTSDRLYFEPLDAAAVAAVAANESDGLLGVIPQFGGQTAINLVHPLRERGIRILGTSPESIDAAEDRGKTSAVLGRQGIPTPAWRSIGRWEDLPAALEAVGFPALLRPSYVLSGRGMTLVRKPADVARYLEVHARTPLAKPLLIDHFLDGAVELNVDAVSDGKDTVSVVMEQFEECGVHSGDSAEVYPVQSVAADVLEKVDVYTRIIARAFGILGLMNVQYAVHGERVYVLEVNPRASRSVPFASKASGIPLADLAIRAILGQALRALAVPAPRMDRVAVKEVALPFRVFPGLTPVLGPEMQSTGESMGIGPTFASAYWKAQLGVGMKRLPFDLPIYVSVGEEAPTPEVHRLISLLVPVGKPVTVSAGSYKEGKLPRLSPSDVDVTTLGMAVVLGRTSDDLRLLRRCVDAGTPYISTVGGLRALTLALAEGRVALEPMAVTTRRHAATAA